MVYNNILQNANVYCLQWSHKPTGVGYSWRYCASLVDNAGSEYIDSDLVKPESAHDEEQLNAHRSEWQDAPESNRKDRVGVPHLFRHMSGVVYSVHKKQNKISLIQ